MTVTGLDPTLERVLDLGGVFAFALSGASLAAHKRFDIVGIAVLAIAAALGGGITRDVLIGEMPPVAPRDQAYLIVPLVAVVLVFVGHRTVERLRRPVLAFDAVGLALFCVVGFAKALDHGLGSLSAVLLGVITAVGGGVIRDMLAREVPSVFKPESALYAIPAALGAVGVAVLWPREALNAATATDRSSSLRRACALDALQLAGTEGARVMRSANNGRDSVKSGETATDDPLPT